MLTQPDIDSLIERAQRMQDGMTINRDLFAKDVLRAALELKQWRNSHHNKEPERKADDPFNDIFGGIFK